MDNDELARALGQYLRTRRIQLGLTQRQVKEHLGFSAQFLGRIEKGQAMVPEEALVALINILGLDRAELENIFVGASRRYINSLFQRSDENIPPASGGRSGPENPKSFFTNQMY